MYYWSPIHPRSPLWLKVLLGESSMTRKLWLTSVVVCVLAVAIACGTESPSPSSPSPAVPGEAQANPDGSTLKATAPGAVSPVNGQKPDFVRLVVNNSSVKFAANIPLSYRFEIYNSGGARVYQSELVPAGPGGQTAHDAAASLEGDQTYQWQARAEYQGTTGPWSSRASFVAPANVGYLRGSELYDPLVNGKTVGNIVGDVTWIPGKGLKLNSFGSYVWYRLPETCTQCEFSVITTNLEFNTEGEKTKIMAMGQGFDDIITNDRRMTVEKRGDPPGIVAWRMITHGDQVDTEGAEREQVFFSPDKSYLWRATWKNNFFNVEIREDAGRGEDIYEKGKHFEGRPYDPNPHIVYIGAPVGRSGLFGASVPDVIYRHVWVSSRERPSNMNQ
jgi:hypothetical protein